jgi:hypothetical protein
MISGKFMKAASLASALAMVWASVAEASTGCTAINALGTQVHGGVTATLTGGPVTLDAGDVITITNGAPFVDGGSPFTFSAPLNVTVNQSQSRSVTVATGGTFTIIRTGNGFSFATSTVTYSCVSASGSGSLNQNTGNAQTAIQNGQQATQTYNDWTNKAVTTGLFGTGGGGGGASLPTTPAPPTAQATLRRLQREEDELVLEIADRPTPEAEQRLEGVRQDLVYARVTLLSQSTARSETTTASGEAPRPPSGPSSFGLSTRDLDACDGEACAPPERRWNAWLETKAIGITDSLAQNNALGFIGVVGADYRAAPWAVVGFAVGGETFETKFGSNGVRSGTVGVTGMPYFGVRLHENVIASGFVGLTSINYNNNPSAGVTSRFNALRFFFGANVTGIWREGDWRFQPTLSGQWASENQSGYTDSAGTNVAQQTVTYGRIAAGPEIGRTFWGPDKSWSVEPFVLAKLQVDFNSSTTFAVNGLALALRPGTLASGVVGVGAELRFQSGFFVRGQGSYDSIGVSGLDVWTGLIRGGMSF